MLSPFFSASFSLSACFPPLVASCLAYGRVALVSGGGEGVGEGCGGDRHAGTPAAWWGLGRAAVGLDRVVRRGTAAGVEGKAAQVGGIGEGSEDEASGSLTIRVRV